MGSSSSELAPVRPKGVRQLNRKKAKLVARILSATRNGISISNLSERLGMSNSMVNPFVQYLNANGLLMVKEEANTRWCVRTELGSRLLETFVELHRMYGEGLREEVSAGAVNYAACPNCRPHPAFPDTPPMTLHQGDRCLMCNNTVSRSLEA